MLEVVRLLISLDILARLKYLMKMPYCDCAGFVLCTASI